MDERPGPLLAYTHAAVRGGGRRGGEVAREPLDRPGFDTREGRGALRAPLGNEVGDRVGAIADTRHVRQLLGEEDVEHAQEEEGVAARADRDVLGRALRRFCAPRINHHDGAAALDDVAEAVPGARSAHQRAVRDRRVRPQDEQVVRAVEVGHREQAQVPEHLGRRAVLRQLIRRGGRRVVSGVQCLAQRDHRKQRPGVRAWVADVGGEAVGAVAGVYCLEAVRREVEGLFPLDLNPVRADPVDRLGKAVRVLIEVRQRRGLRADVALRGRIVLVARDP
jgi:hypothetical protein